jgi:hypothetical protein
MVSQPKKEGDEPAVFRSVTLVVTPAEAEAIELAATSGRPRLVLRNGNDKSISLTPGVTAANLRGAQPKPIVTYVPVPTPVASPVATPIRIEPTFTTIKVIRGTAESEVRFDSGWFDTKYSNSDTRSISNSDTDSATGKP